MVAADFKKRFERKSFWTSSQKATWQMLELKCTAFSCDCLDEMTTGYLMYTRGNSFPVKKFKFAQKTVSSGIRLFRE